MNPDLPVDPAELRRFREALLRKVAAGKDPALAEMAREVQAGRISMRDAAFGAYREQFTALREKAAAALRDVSKEDMDRAMAEYTLDDAVEQFDAMPDPEPDEEPPAKPAPARRPEPEDDEDSILLAPPRTDRPTERPQRAQWQRRWQG
ncbi:hypothetical protein [Amycolatopsis suaedae]|uniref:Uncharacterized protein n=1 Tax=Amycolatopsis suaedae TaxID=2510978 RepID=A0A4Q7J5I2_9PSEU|nr:hypothetical protein [Amycolatopsis suaedae]RZQ61942.1 hypothetical protein EWH70_20225 [Amycolatopsis suaedae]